MDGQHAQYVHGGQEGKEDERSRNEQQYTAQPPPPPPVHYPATSAATSPPASASPFAFAPPPLSSTPSEQSLSRPPLPLHHSEPPPHNPQYQAYPPKPPPVPHHNSFPTYPGSAYPSSVPMGARSFSNGTPRGSPLQSHMPRPAPASEGPSATSPALAHAHSDSSYPYQRQLSYNGSAQPQHSPLQMHQQSPQRSMYPQYYAGPYGGQPPPGPGGADMPRSLSYPSAMQHPHHPYHSAYPHQPHPMSHPPLGAPYEQYQHPPPQMHRNVSASVITGMADMDIGRQPVSTGAYAPFSTRLPLVDRPFKCDECVQSFNRNHDLKRHKRIHLSVKPFGCDKCGKTFSRKDALRRHWLVKGCRGEDGATAPIIPLFPINGTPGLSPPSPAINHSPVDGHFPSSSMGYGHPSAPPPLTSLPPRQSSDQQILVTPNELAAQSSARSIAVAAPLEEPLGLEQGMSGADLRGNPDNGSSHEDGYFEGVVGIKSDGTAVLEKAQNSAGPSYPPSAQLPHPNFHHPYRRHVSSPYQQTNHSPSTTHFPTSRPYTPSTLGQDGKPVFAMPFAHMQQMAGGGMGNTGVEMEKQASQMSQASETEYTAAPRWHRPSFPFPPTNNVYNPNFDTSGHMDTPQHHPVAQGYGQ